MAGSYNAKFRASMLQKQKVQIVLFSATFPEKVIKYADIFAPQANQITLRHEELTVDGIKQLYMDCASEDEKYDVLTKLYGLMTIGSSIIFVKVHTPNLSAFCGLLTLSRSVRLLLRSRDV